jgi:hypothetical protein
MRVYIYAVEGSNHVYRLVGTADITDAKEATELAVKYAKEYGCVDVCSGEQALATAGKEPDMKSS